METVAVAVAEATAMDNLAGKRDPQRKSNRIQVSNTKKPLFFYLNLAKRYIRQYNDVELSALGMAIPTVVTIAEILKSNGLAIEKKVLTSTVGSKDDSRGRPIQKAKIEILLGKTENSDSDASNSAPTTSDEDVNNKENEVVDNKEDEVVEEKE